MGALSSLNTYAQEAVAAQDLRNATVYFSYPTSFDLSIVDEEGVYDIVFQYPFDIREIVRPDQTQVYINIEFPTFPTSTATPNYATLRASDTLPSGVSITNTGTTWTVDRISTVEQWDAIKNILRITIPTDFEGFFFYDVSFTYYQVPDGTVSQTYRVGVYTPTALLQSQFALSVPGIIGILSYGASLVSVVTLVDGGGYIRGGASSMSANFTQPTLTDSEWTRVREPGPGSVWELALGTYPFMITSANFTTASGVVNKILSMAATQNAAINYTAEGASNFTSFLTQSALGGYLLESSAAFGSQFTQPAIDGSTARIRFGSSSMSSQLLMTTAIRRIKGIFETEASVFSLSADATRIFGIYEDLQGVFTETTTGQDVYRPFTNVNNFTYNSTDPIVFDATTSPDLIERSSFTGENITVTIGVDSNITNVLDFSNRSISSYASTSPVSIKMDPLDKDRYVVGITPATYGPTQTYGYIVTPSTNSALALRSNTTDRFVFDAAVRGNYAAIIHGGDSVDVYNVSTSQSKIGTFTNTNNNASDMFQVEFDSGTTVVSGDRSYSSTYSGQGAVYRITCNSSASASTILSPNAQAGGQFGDRVAANGSYWMATAPGENRVYLYQNASAIRTHTGVNVNVFAPNTSAGCAMSDTYYGYVDYQNPLASPGEETVNFVIRDIASGNIVQTIDLEAAIGSLSLTTFIKMTDSLVIFNDGPSTTEIPHIIDIASGKLIAKGTDLTDRDTDNNRVDICDDYMLIGYNSYGVERRDINSNITYNSGTNEVSLSGTVSEIQTILDSGKIFMIVDSGVTSDLTIDYSAVNSSAETSLTETQTVTYT